MKITKIKNVIALAIAAGAMYVASTSATMCVAWGGSLKNLKCQNHYTSVINYKCLVDKKIRLTHNINLCQAYFIYFVLLILA